MSNTYKIVSYDPAHKEKVAVLQTHLWTRDVGLATRYFRWKYEENPYSKEPLIYLAFQGSELVGMRGFYGAKWELGQPREVHTVLVADDFVISPQHRDRGLVTLIMNAAFEDLAQRGHKHVFNLSGGRGHRIGLAGHGLEKRRPPGAHWLGDRARLPSSSAGIFKTKALFRERRRQSALAIRR